MPEDLMKQLGRWAREQEAREAGAGIGEAEAALEPLSEERMREVKRKAVAVLRRSDRPWLGGLMPIWLSVAAAAAVVLFAIFWSQRSDSLPDYQIAFEGGIRALRGPQDPSDAMGPGAVQRLRADSSVRIVFSPQKPATSRPGLAAFLVSSQNQGPPERVALPFEVSAEGAMQVTGQAGSLFGSREGNWTLWIAIDTPAKLPDSFEELQKQVASGRAFQTRLLLEP